MGLARLAFRVLLILLILFIAIGLLLPSGSKVERSVVIAAPVATVFAELNSADSFHRWSPWSRQDPDTDYAFSGPDAGVGARVEWQSAAAQMKYGSQEITASVPDQRVEMALEFGDKGGGTVVFLLIESGTHQTRLDWQFETEFGWDLFGRYLGLMLDNMIGMAYEQSLDRLKRHLEGSAPGDPRGRVLPL